MPRQPLGRGLSALIGEAAHAAASVETSLELDIDLIDPNPEQPRTRFAPANLDELAQSIKVNGVVQPIVVRAVAGRFQIVAGERRWRAAQKAELRRIPAVIREVADDRLLELALIENIQRQELNPIEEARAFRKLIDSIGLTQEQVAERVGKDRTVITTAIRLLRLPDDVLKLIEEGTLSAGHGRALLMSDNAETQHAVARAAIENAWSVRETERAVKRARRQPLTIATKDVTTVPDANMKVAETKLMRRLSTNVKIQPASKGSGGKIEIEYYGPQDLDRIYELIMNKEKEV